MFKSIQIQVDSWDSHVGMQLFNALFTVNRKRQACNWDLVHQSVEFPY